jgi:C-terminal processing protease CtpA/Prc
MTKYSEGGSLGDLVAAAEESVKGSLAGGKGLREFLQTIDRLEPAEMALLVENAIGLLEGFYVHLPLKRAMHAVDPLQRLRLLQRRLPQLTSEIAFHHEMTEIFTSLRDLHTNYILPAHFSKMRAFLPFEVEACFEGDKRQYIVSKTVPGFHHPTFMPGVELIYWNGVPIERAVEIAAEYHAGSNPAARHARGVAGLTKRAMIISPPPDEEWVVVGYKDSAGQTQEFRADWTITGLPAELSPPTPPLTSDAAAAFGVDLEGEAFRQINKMLFAQHIVSEKRRLEDIRESARARTTAMGDGAFETAAVAESQAVTNAVQGTASTMPDVFGARPVSIDGRAFAYVRILTFSVADDVQFVQEFLRLIDLPEMPKDGLIIDVRGNGGGLIWAGERLLQLLTPQAIEPCRVQFINTQMNLQLCKGNVSLKTWYPSIERALETGAAFSSSFPITPPERCNDIGQRYYGPVLLITDARCYSTTDIFSAGFQDHKIGPILGTDNNTGAGGANVWTLEQLREFFTSGGMQPPLSALPKGAGMRVAIRRTLRVGDEAGTELEDLGVRPNFEHKLTRNDTLNDNPDLIAHAAGILKTLPIYKFEVTSSRSGSKLKLHVTANGVDYVDAFLNGRPLASGNVSNGTVDFELPVDREFVPPAGAAAIELRGYAGNKLVCRSRLSA